MADFSSKELYIMNGGQKLYIWKDGFGDVYNATEEEEQQWRAEVIARDLKKLDTETNETTLQFAIDNLRYHAHPGLEELLRRKAGNSSSPVELIFAEELRKIFGAKK